LNKKTKQSTNQNKNVAGIIATEAEKAFRPRERQTTATFANEMGAG
jgi:hypothetical protein